MSKSEKNMLDSIEEAELAIEEANAYSDYIQHYYDYQRQIDDDNEKSRRLSWDEMFMEIAKVVAKRSKDPRTKVGAVLVDENNHILSIGYNAEPRGFRYDFNWNSDEKYDYVIHAELNAITNASTITSNFGGAKIYLTLSPCKDCIKLLIQYGIKTIYYLDEYKDIDKVKFIAEHSNIELKKFAN